MAWRNIRGTSDRSCRCGTWLKHWFVETGLVSAACAVVGCSGDAEVGAHVQSTHGNSTKEHWIVPLCRRCNGLSTLFDLKTSAIPVSANTQRMGCYRP